MSSADWQIGYCTNVHAGGDLATTQQNLEKHAVAVKELFSPNDPMGIGLWLSNSSAMKLIEDNQVEIFKDWLDNRGIIPFTLNGFPFGDFHKAVVKHDVYLPTWAEKARLDFTLNLIEILHRILPQGMAGSISTLPISWPEPPLSTEFLQFAAQQLIQVAKRLADLENTTGREISVCIEPEPGCYLETSGGLVDFFERYLFSLPEKEIARRYLRVCHDICHAAVMFEPQSTVIERYTNAGIQIGKVQVSSAIGLDCQTLSASDRAAAIKQLGGFAEDRYLHQTVVRRSGKENFFEDLPLALEAHENETSNSNLEESWRVHFHVPIYLEKFGHLLATQSEIHDCLKAIKSKHEIQHFEVETYAWNVLPHELQQPSLAKGIAKELEWFKAQI